MRFSLLLMLLIMLNLLIVVAQSNPYDVIIVRGDIYPDWTVATAYAKKTGSMVLLLFPGQNDGEIISMIEGLSQFKKNIRVLVIGQPNAIPEDFYRRLSEIATAERIGGVNRVETSINLATYYWRDANSLIIVDGLRPELYLPALLLSMNKSAPIVYSSNGSLPNLGDLLHQMNSVKTVYVIDQSLSSRMMSEIKSLGIEVIEMGSVNVTVGHSRSEETSGNIHIILVIVILISSLILFAIVMLNRRRKASDILQFFSPDERRIIEIVSGRKEISQDDLSEVTGFSRPKISRIVSDLVDRKVLERERVGKTFVVRLTENFISASGLASGKGERSHEHG
ncbi:DUF7343 domain-containing protein [Candidatus Methanodesulfokora washburnensis]|jgi:uncharacterized membrane protein|uniref:DUF7343 domain-containing protein n=1 Tax=Candidatus Methanodesulfokora washburnensis TaxID=2478471 RepID=A0A3R9X284_9CREN|nr:MarR family transcriptional regulator [Candidatus Methanodesulfokores washburnensis]RSN73603.1 hypothetical protein D6D85_10040 [Candidatus Methanodesulfokores washburnensis]